MPATSAQPWRSATNMAIRVTVFKTNVSQMADALTVIELLTQQLPQCRINFDLDDCDRILRIESTGIEVNHGQVCQQLITLGYTCALLP
jgi:hypothetical protein